MNTPTKESSKELLNQYIESESLNNHCKMVASAMEAYARYLKKDQTEIEEWWSAGLMHDIDWEKFPDEHPHKAVEEILPQAGYSDSVIEAVRAHAPERTGKEPEAEIERYLFACD
ncbi:MAG: HD domain-containing protein, partial [Candidatus Paceibacterota bacterium]